MIFRPLFAARLIQRDNRFRASVLLDGHSVHAHIANSGRLHDVLQPNAKVWIARAKNTNRKTAYDLVLVQQGEILISVDARLPPKLLGEALEKRCLSGWRKPLKIEYEVVFGDSRLDLRLQEEEGMCWVETKSVTRVQDGKALFPDAPTERGRKHLGELMKAVKGGQRASVVFVVQRGDAKRFQPNHAVDPRFTAVLAEAKHAGVQVKAMHCTVTVEGIHIAGEIEVDLS